MRPVAILLLFPRRSQLSIPVSLNLLLMNAFSISRLRQDDRKQR